MSHALAFPELLFTCITNCKSIYYLVGSSVVRDILYVLKALHNLACVPIHLELDMFSAIRAWVLSCASPCHNHYKPSVLKNVSLSDCPSCSGLWNFKGGLCLTNPVSGSLVQGIHHAQRAFAMHSTVPPEIVSWLGVCVKRTPGPVHRGRRIDPPGKLKLLHRQNFCNSVALNCTMALFYGIPR